ncbi:MAG: PAC2 family protein [Nitrososphaerota archaeon]|nr:PAC2 family protein [Nitrososphaerota archaeon]MDG6921788.1 PAC2 family protein [Nitrososphaerota archaeon]
MKLELVQRDDPSLNDPIIVCGLPGAALVGKFAVDHLVSELPAKPLAEIYSNEFPTQIIVKDNGIATSMHNEILYWKNNNHGSDLVLFTSDAQPTSSEMGYSLSERALDFLVSKCKVKELVTLGAYVTGTRTDKPRVYATATDAAHAKIIEQIGCTLMRYGEIKGMNGLLLGMAKIKGVLGYSLLGETEGYSFDGRASSIVLECLGKMVGVKFDLEKLNQRAKEAQKLLDAVLEVENKRNQGPREDQAPKPNYIT